MPTPTSRRWPTAAAAGVALAGTLWLSHSGPAYAGHQAPAPGDPAVTLLHQNFPNPFPTPSSAVTCIWFDLHRPSRVRLTVHDMRGTPVRTLIPSAGVGESFPAGRFGRAAGAASGCDPRFSWDGTADDGRTLPAGAYLLKLRAGAHESFRRVLFRGR